ncbi:hypothetical protein [Streptomyces sp. NPDC056361]|uniref:hypothetical protein n=1 Tax=Streptomyces sp. NPDC056361 TaxID=3345795 RepID=UPI0035D6744B
MTTTGRRALLVAGAAAGAAALAGCGSPSDGGTPPPSAAEREAQREAERVARAEAALRQRAVASARGLLERYDATLAAHPALAPRLTPLRRSVAAHAAALGEGGTTVAPAPDSAKASAAPPATSSTTPPATATTPAGPAPLPVPADPRAALKELAAAARTAADGHTAALLTAPPEYARLLASVAAAGAAHAYLLTEGARA